jgi:hypothetical protein
MPSSLDARGHDRARAIRDDEAGRVEVGDMRPIIAARASQGKTCDAAQRSGAAEVGEQRSEPVTIRVVCTLAAFVRVFPACPLVVAANRDEYLDGRRRRPILLRDAPPRALGGAICARTAPGSA